ncbi:MULTISPECIES: hypothetical protein [unclassified Micromonospora]|uniref:hypothetical protein n=1 Tax=unclassified Micromonospora TaxID=2617518 RepID=UPI0033A023C7
MRLHAADLVLVDRSASPQFVVPIRFRLIRVLDRTTTYDGWAWLDGYQVNRTGQAFARREIYVQPENLRKLTDPAAVGRSSLIGG